MALEGGHVKATVVCGTVTELDTRWAHLKGYRHVPLKTNTDVLPSEEEQARMAPNSAGAQEMELTVGARTKPSALEFVPACSRTLLNPT